MRSSFLFQGHVFGVGLEAPGQGRGRTVFFYKCYTVVVYTGICGVFGFILCETRGLGQRSVFSCLRTSGCSSGVCGRSGPSLPLLK